MNCIAVVVTRNRIDLLKECVSALLKQTTPLSKIVIFDNVSDDGTIDFLKTLDKSKFEIIFSDKNVGGAGGFHYGIKKAYELGGDYFWIMDDDTIPTETALEELIKSFDVLKDKNTGFVGSQVLFSDGTPCMMNISNTVFRWNEFLSQKIVQVSHTSFVSVLIPRSVVKDVGLPMKDFFIWGDDVEYTTRIAKKYEGFISASSIAYHRMNENKGVDIFNCEKNRISRFFFFYRNLTFTHLTRHDWENYKSFMRTTKEILHKLRWNSYTYRRLKIKTIKKGIRAGRKFKTSIEYVDGRPPKELNARASFIFFRQVFLFLKRISKLAIKKIDRDTGSHLVNTKEFYARESRDKMNCDNKFLFYAKGMTRSKKYINYLDSKHSSFYHLLSNVKLDTSISDYFFGSIDIYKIIKIDNRIMDNCSPDYYLYTDNGLKSLLINDSDDEFSKNNNEIINAIILFVNRAIKKVSSSHMKNKENVLIWLNDFIDKPAQSYGDVLQRVIIINQLMWQSGHRLMGYGRLDHLLDKFDNNKIDENEALTYVKEFLKLQHHYFAFKSNEMLGDTGQIIILGGNEPNRKYFCNTFTSLFIMAAKELHSPDPKLLLRVSDKTPIKLLKLAIDCLLTGVGYPLFSNDDVVIPTLVNNGYELLDAYNYTTSACWEPIPGNCIEQNNISVIDFTKPFDLISKKNDISKMKDFWEYYFFYKAHMCGYADYVVKQLDSIIWDFDPFMSSSLYWCRKYHKDVVEGGAKYNNYGILSVGMANAVNSLVNLKKLAYETNKFTASELNRMRLDNFNNNEDVAKLLKSTNYSKFGDDNDAIVFFTNDITKAVSKSFEKYKNIFGGSVKFGLSSPGYITVGQYTNATFDGRLAGEPYSVHISSDNGATYTELSNFACRLNYFDGRFNGNVLDMMATPNLINDNKEKFISFVKQAIKNGVFQFQFNITSYDMLVKAKNDPNFMPNLIVRVWGFSTYFHSLPEEYKDYVIQRAYLNEHKSI